LEQLVAELNVATINGHPEQASLLRDEMAALEGELRRAVGLHGRARRNSATERARINVTRVIRLALSRLIDVAPEIGGNLAGRIRTGTFCSYQPPTDNGSTRPAEPE
jgi:hypothetical protein